MARCHLKNQILVSQPKDHQRFHYLVVLLHIPFFSFSFHAYIAPQQALQSNQTNGTEQKVGFWCSHRPSPAYWKSHGCVIVAQKWCEGPEGGWGAVKCWVSTSRNLSGKLLHLEKVRDFRWTCSRQSWSNGREHWSTIEVMVRLKNQEKIVFFLPVQFWSSSYFICWMR